MSYSYVLTVEMFGKCHYETGETSCTAAAFYNNSKVHRAKARLTPVAATDIKSFSLNVCVSKYIDVHFPSK